MDPIYKVTEVDHQTEFPQIRTKAQAMLENPKKRRDQTRFPGVLGSAKHEGGYLTATQVRGGTPQREVGF